MWKRDLTFVAVVALLVTALGSYLGASKQPTSALVNAPHDPSIDATLAAVDAEFAEHWNERGIQPAPRAELLTIARRLSLAMTGTIPSLEEIRQLESADQADAVRMWVGHLLADKRYADYQAERLARVFVGVDEGPFLIYRRRRFVSWLSDQISANVPYDKIASQLITSAGLWTDSPAVNFVTATIGGNQGDRPDEVVLASRTTRAFLGLRLDCMQCHDDNLYDEWRQTDFHELAAFYAEASPTFVGILDKPREYEYKYLGADKEITVEPSVPFGDELLSKEGHPRRQLANWITHPDNRPFARTTVNRIWALAFGKPLVDPVDNIPLEGPYPPGLELLADDFASHGFDLARLWKIIARSAPFQRDSRADFEVTRKHESSWAAFPLTRLRPEQVAGAIVQAAKLRTIDAESHVLVRFARFAQTGDFVRQYGDTGEDEFSNHGGTIPQRLLMLNGELVHEKTKDDLVANATTRIAQLAATPQAAITALYASILTRIPTEREIEHFLSLLDSVFDAARTPWAEHIGWVLINSTEFSWNH